MTTDPVYFLLVDDLEENLLSLDALLRREGLVLLKARSGEQALEILLQHQVALALLDVQMPGMDGFELAELMRGMERTHRIPIIFLTAGSDDRQRRFRGYEAGAVDFLHKPIEPDILKSKADVFFELYRQKQLIAAHRDELEATSAFLKDADKRKNEFLATLAHELRNPLAPIRNGLEILRLSPNSAEAESVRQMMDRQLNHLVRLIDDLLDISRVRQGKFNLQRKNITMQDVLQSALEVSRPLIENGKHTLTVDISDEPVWLNADLTRLAQIVSNLVNNAAKYTQDGGKIHLSVTTQNDHVVIAISDNGLGIPKDMLTQVFERFTQVNRSLDRSQGGLGIGLALVSQLVDMHGGTIKAESAGLGLGSTFTVTLPTNMPKEAALSLPEKTSQAKTQPNSLNILVVDDNLPSAQTIGWMLEMIGHKTTLAHDGLKALETARELKPDVILLDIGLPTMDGYTVCRELRKDPAFKNTMLVAQTGWGQDKDRREAFEAGFDHHLLKPVDLNEFSTLLANVRKKS